MTTKNLNTETSSKKVSATIKFILIKQDTAPKLSTKNPGSLTYQIGKHPESKALALRTIKNNSGGYFSKEWVELEAIKGLLDTIDANKSFKSSTLRDLFQGKSSNNSGFCAAICRAEGLLTAVPDNAFLHQKGHPIDDWIIKLNKLKPLDISDISSGPAPKPSKGKPETSTKAKANPTKPKSTFNEDDSAESTDTNPENDT